MRIRHYVKNLLVFAVPFLAGKLGDKDIILNTLLTFVFFCTISSAIYLINDVKDVEFDKRHKTKSKRPLANGLVTKKGTIILFFVLVFVNLFSFIISIKMFYILLLYFTIQIFYTIVLKNIILLDLFSVSSGFVVRSIAGGYVSSLTISNWFLIFTFTTSLFIIAGKRYSEKIKSGDIKSRKVLDNYTPELLSNIWRTCLTLSLVFYSLWAIDFESSIKNVALLSALPLAAVLFHLSQLIELGDLENPEEILSKNYEVIFPFLIMLIMYSSLIYFGST